MANIENLEPMMGKNRNLSTEEARRIGSKGGKASVESRRRERTLKETLEKLLSLPINDEGTKAFIKQLGFNDEELDNKTAINVAMYQEALKGNVKAYELIRDTMGEKPTDKVAIEEAPQIVLKRPDK